MASTRLHGARVRPTRHVLAEGAIADPQYLAVQGRFGQFLSVIGMIEKLLVAFRGDLEACVRVCEG